MRKKPPLVICHWALELPFYPSEVTLSPHAEAFLVERKKPPILRAAGWLTAAHSNVTSGEAGAHKGSCADTPAVFFARTGIRHVCSILHEGHSKYVCARTTETVSYTHLTLPTKA